jgi:hypothetical protein
MPKPTLPCPSGGWDPAGGVLRLRSNVIVGVEGGSGIRLGAPNFVTPSQFPDSEPAEL